MFQHSLDFVAAGFLPCAEAARHLSYGSPRRPGARWLSVRQSASAPEGSALGVFSDAAADPDPEDESRRWWGRY